MNKLKFNDNWLFSNMDGSISRQSVTLPHDAMQTEQRIPGLRNGEATGYYPGGKYIYEKVLNCTEREAAQTTLLEFEGIYQKSEIYLNDVKVGGHIYGYTDFFVDLTGKLKTGKNHLRVIADNTQTPNSRWYSGSGIYRDVYLHTAGESFICPQSLKVSTLSVAPAKVEVSARAVCGEHCYIQVEILWQGKVVAAGRTGFASDGEISGSSTPLDIATTGRTAACIIDIPSARLWSDSDPALYEVRVMLVCGETELDRTQDRFGVRQITVSHEKGFQINGRTIKLRGGCIHHDHGPLGACSFKNAELRRVRKLKEAGFNAIRYAHNPAGKVFLDVCDELGMYVMDEAFDMWACKKSDRDYGMYFTQEWEGDMSAMVRVAYNHPSVVLYSIGNEILDIGLPSGAEWSRKLADCCHKNDPTRPVLNAFSPSLVCMAAKGIGINKFDGKADDVVDPREVSKDSAASGSKLVNILITLGPLMMKLIGSPKKLERLAAPSIEAVDISGYNYGIQNYPVHMEHHPEGILVGSETFNPQISEHWKYVMAHDYMIGEFTWTAWDYLGETGIGLARYEGMSRDFSYPYPCITGYCGCFDLAGDLEGEGAHVLAVWDQLEKPFIAVSPIDHYGQKVKMGSWRSIDAMPTWSWDGCEGKTAEIFVFANGDAAEAELLLNGKSIGRLRMTENKAAFTTAYAPGTLEAVTYDAHGKENGRAVLVSAAPETRLRVVADRDEICAADKDVAYVDIYITDLKGTVKMQDHRKVMVSVAGAGVLAALGSGDPLPTDSFTGNSYGAYNGHVVAVVRATGEAGDIRIKAEAEGLKPQVVTIAAID